MKTIIQIFLLFVYNKLGKVKDKEGFSTFSKLCKAILFAPECDIEILVYARVTSRLSVMRLHYCFLSLDSS